MDVYMVWVLEDNGEARLEAAFDAFSVDENYEGWKERVDAAAKNYPEGTQVFVSDSDTIVKGTGSVDITLIWVSDQEYDEDQFYTKWLQDAWSEFDLDANYEGFEEAVAKLKDIYRRVEVTTMSVDYDKIVTTLTTVVRV